MKTQLISLLFLSATFTLSAAPTDRATLELLMADMAAVQYRDTDSALFQERLLLLLKHIRNGADVNLTLPITKGNTALHYACAIGNLSITNWLLENGANPNALTIKGATPLMCVGTANKAAITKLLLRYGAQEIAPAAAKPYKADHIDSYSMKAYIESIRGMRIQNETQELCQKRLLTLLPRILNGADVNLTLPETKGNTALHYACGLGRQDIVKWLLINGANPNARTHKGATPLDCVSGYNSDAIRNLLRQYGAK